MPKLSYNRIFLLLAISFLPLNGCTSLIVNPILDPLALSLQQQQDITLLKDGAPSLLLMMDGMIIANPDNKKFLLEGTRAYSSYASALGEFDEKDRAVVVSAKAKEYGLRLLAMIPEVQKALNGPISDLETALQSVNKSDIDLLFWGAYGWATWISFQDGSPAAIADLPRIERMMLRVIALDNNYYYGAPHIFLGLYYGSIPAAYGGKPEESHKHFEEALKIANRNFFAAQVAYAETYARLNFDRELFEKLLNEVLLKPVDTIPELTAGNEMAVMRAKRLLAKADEYF